MEGTGTAKSSLMRIGYDNFPANPIKGGGLDMFRSKAEQDAAYPDSVHLGSSLSPTEAFLKNLAGGFVPNFNPLGRAISAERMGLKQMGSSARPQVGYDARVGIGVFNSSQGSLSNAINQHLMAGQRPSTLKSTGAAKGGIPNFFVGGDTAATTAMMLGMGMMGMGSPSNKREEIQRYQEDAERNRRETKELKQIGQQQTDELKKIQSDTRKSSLALNI